MEKGKSRKRPYQIRNLEQFKQDYAGTSSTDKRVILLKQTLNEKNVSLISKHALIVLFIENTAPLVGR